MFDLSAKSILRQLIWTITSMDEAIQQLMKTFSKDIATGPTWTMATKMLEITQTLALGLLMVYWLMNFVNELTEIDYKHIGIYWYGKQFIKLFVGKALVENASRLCIAVYNLVGYVLKEIGLLNGTFELYSKAQMQELIKVIDDMGLIEKLVFKMDLLIPQIIIMVCCIAIFLMAEIRILNIYLLIIISPICLASAVVKGASSCYGFIREYIGTTAQAIIIMISITLYNGLVAGNINLQITGIESLWKLVIHTVVLLTTILTSQGIAKMLSYR